MPLSLLIRTFWSTHWEPLKLDHIKGNALKFYGARGLKEGKEMNDIPKSIWSSCLVLKNPNISSPPNNPNRKYDEKSEPKSFPKEPVKTNPQPLKFESVLGCSSVFTIF